MTDKNTILGMSIIVTLASCSSSPKTENNTTETVETVSVRRPQSVRERNVTATSTYEKLVKKPGNTDMTDEMRMKSYLESYDRDFEKFTGNMRDEEFMNALDRIVPLYYRDSARSVSAESYYNHLRQFVPDSRSENSWKDGENRPETTLGLFEIEQFDGSSYRKEYESDPFMHGYEGFFTSITKVNDYYLASYWTPIECEPKYTCVVFDNEFDVTDKMVFLYKGCYSDPDESAPLPDPEMFSHYTYVKKNSDIGPYIEVHEDGSVRTVYQESYIVNDTVTNEKFVINPKLITDYTINSYGKFEIVNKPKPISQLLMDEIKNKK